MTVDNATARPWHVSDPSHGSRSRAGDPAELQPAPTPTPKPALAPLWRRVVTGRVIWWRVQRLRNALRWKRRHFIRRVQSTRRGTARRALRWHDRHPEFRQVLKTDGFFHLIGAVVSMIRSSFVVRRSRSPHQYGHRPTIEVPSGLDISGLRDAIALRAAELDQVGQGPVNCRAELAHGLIVLQPVDTGDAGTGAAARLLDAVDTSTWNPQWFQLWPNPNTVKLSELPPGRRRGQRRARAGLANRSRVVVCDVVEGANTVETARAIAELASSGAPLVGGLPDEVAQLLGPDVSELIGAASADDLLDDARRERHSVALRCAALGTFSARGRWRRIGEVSDAPRTATPSVSVLLASNRADDVVDAARQVAAQRGGDLQLVVGLHGAHMPADLDEQLHERFRGDLVIRRFADDANLGQVLNALSGEADGELVTKWDDDDWYHGEHLADLITALEYSGADMVAKAAEFVYLESLDLTVRRFATGSERFSTTVAGGTLLLPRTELEQVGWADAPRRVDRLLIEALERRARTVYRTHGFGYVLRRRGGGLSQHTWEAGDAYFLRQSVGQRPGLDLAFAGFAEPSSTGVTP